MTVQEFLNLEDGVYIFTDAIQNYKYSVKASTFEEGHRNEGKRFFRIYQEERILGENIFLEEQNREGKTVLSTCSGVGGLMTHTDEGDYVVNQLHKIKKAK